MRFVILKSQEGNGGFDIWFKRNVDNALAEGLEPFAYTFAYPLPPGKDKSGNPIAGRDPLEQAKLFVDRVHGASRAMEGRPIFLDYEWPEPPEWGKWGCTAPQINAWCEANAAEVERLSGVTPIIYTYPWWWAAVSKGTDVSWAAKYPLWIASYPTTVGWPAEGAKPVIPKPWDDWLFWQFDGNKGLKLPNGIDSDFCLFNGTEDDLAKVAGKRPDRPVGDGVLGPAAVDEVARK